jgi:hypothetical protein
MKKNKFLFLGMLAKVTTVTLALTFTLVLAGCPGPDNPTFTSTTNSATANTVDVLGVIGSLAESSDTAQATAAITGGKIVITSVAAGTATITVSEPRLSTVDAQKATIAVTVAADGAISLGAITKATGIEDKTSAYEIDASGTASGLSIQSTAQVGETILVRLTGAITGVDSNVMAWYDSGNNLTHGTDQYGETPFTAAHYALVTIKGVLPTDSGLSTDDQKKAHFATITNKGLAAFYGYEWIQPGRRLNRAAGTGRWTHSGYSTVSGQLPETTNVSTGTLELKGTDYTGMLWRNDSNQYIQVELDGPDFAPGGGDARILVIDFSAVTWPAE